MPAKTAVAAAADDRGKSQHVRTLLTIDTLTTIRQNIVVDGTAYEVLEPADFGIKKQAVLYKVAKRIQDAFGDEGENMTDGDVELIQAQLTKFVDTVIPGLPGAVMDRLKDTHKMAIVQAFSEAVAKTSGPAQTR